MAFTANVQSEAKSFFNFMELAAKEEHHKEGHPKYKMRLVYWEKRMREGIDWMYGKK